MFLLSLFIRVQNNYIKGDTVEGTQTNMDELIDKHFADEVSTYYSDIIFFLVCY